MDLNSDSPYGIAQNVKLTIGSPYSLTFYIKPNSNANILGTSSQNIAIFTGSVQATGALIQKFSTSKSSSSSSWSIVSYNFTATQAITTIHVWSTTLGTYGPLVDNFNLVDVSASSSPLTIVNPIGVENPLSSMVIIVIQVDKNYCALTFNIPLSTFYRSYSH